MSHVALVAFICIIHGDFLPILCILSCTSGIHLDKNLQYCTSVRHQLNGKLLRRQKKEKNTK